MLSPTSSAKAYVAAAASFLTALLAEWTADNPFELRDLVVGLVAALVTFGATYAVPNSPDKLNEAGHITISGFAHQVEEAIEHSKEKGQSAVTVLLIVVLVLAAIFLAERIF